LFWFNIYARFVDVFLLLLSLGIGSIFVLFVMDETIVSAVLVTVASVLAVGVVILEDIRSRKLLLRESHVNREYG
jgi:hypothetical protein